MHGTASRAGLWVLVVALLSAAVAFSTAVAGQSASVGGAPAASSTPSPPRTAVRSAGSVGPTATIGGFDCERLQVGITLDNSGSTQAATFGYATSFLRPLRAPFSGADATTPVEVPPGRTKVVVVPVRGDASTEVTVHVPDGGQVRAQGVCGNVPGATFGPADCATLRWGLTVDNSRSPLPTRYRWALTDPAGPVWSETVDVAAGEVVGVALPLIARSWVVVKVTVDGKGVVATSDRRTCGRPVLDPRASFGPVDCRDVSAAVVVDNARGSSRVRVHLPGRVDVVLRSGETRSLRLHLPIAQRLTATANVLAEGPPMELAGVSTGRCSMLPADAPRTPAQGRTTSTRRSPRVGEVTDDWP